METAKCDFVLRLDSTLTEKRTPFDACKWCEENCLGKDKTENMAKACNEECKRHCQKNTRRRFFRPIFKVSIQLE